MESSSGARRWLNGTLRALIVLGVVLAVLLTALWALSSHLRGPLIRYAERRYERRIVVAGRFDAHLFALQPRIVAERVTIGNPSWVGTGTTAEIGHLELTYAVSSLRHPTLQRVEMRQAVLNLYRDEAGRANWQGRDPASGPGPGPPLVHDLAMPDAQVHLDDRRRHLQFEGTVSAGPAAPGATAALRVSGGGQLNGRDVRFTLDGDPLVTVARDRPYHFQFTETSSGSQLDAHGVLPQPFDFQALEASFTASGEDLKDLYFLTGVTLLDTGRYRLSGQFARRGQLFEFTDLRLSSGESDLQGRVSIRAKHLEADLTSNRLRVSDLGARAAGRDAPQKTHLLPDTPFHLTRLRDRDAVVRFNVRTLEAGRFVLRDGKIEGELRIDFRHELPEASVDVRATDLRLGPVSGQPLIEGPLRARVNLHGKGNSVHALASKANGKVTVVLPHGELRASVAELAGLDLRALGLKMTGDSAATPVRCGVASFDVQAGLLTARSLILDTEPVLITGEGVVDLQSEGLDMRLQGRPKHPRLRLRSPLLVHGALRHPSVSGDMTKPAAQAGGAIALGVLLSPVAAMLAFVDPGLAKDTNCAALLAQAGSTDR